MQMEGTMHKSALPAAIFLMLSGLMLSGPAAAQASDAAEIAQLAEAKKSTELSLPALQQQLDEPTQQNERLMKEYKLYDEQVKNRVGPMAKAYETKVSAHNDRVKRSDAEIARHNSGCTGTLPKPQYDKCASERPTLQRIVNENNASKARLDSEKTAVLNERSKYSTAMEKLSAQMKSNFALWQQRKKTYDETVQKIARYRQRLVDLCAKASTPEALKHCHSIGWDGARRDLPPLMR